MSRVSMAHAFEKTMRRFRSLSPKKQQKTANSQQNGKLFTGKGHPSAERQSRTDPWGHSKAVEDFFQTANCHSSDCEATLVVEKARFTVCKHQLSHASGYFRCATATDDGGGDDDDRRRRSTTDDDEDDDRRPTMTTTTTMTMTTTGARPSRPEAKSVLPQRRLCGTGAQWRQ